MVVAARCHGFRCDASVDRASGGHFTNTIAGTLTGATASNKDFSAFVTVQKVNKQPQQMNTKSLPSDAFQNFS